MYARKWTLFSEQVFIWSEVPKSCCLLTQYAVLAISEGAVIARVRLLLTRCLIMLRSGPSVHWSIRVWLDAFTAFVHARAFSAWMCCTVLNALSLSVSVRFFFSSNCLSGHHFCARNTKHNCLSGNECNSEGEREKKPNKTGIRRKEMDYLNTYFVVHVFVINGMKNTRISIHILSLWSKKKQNAETNTGHEANKKNIQKLANKWL